MPNLQQQTEEEQQVNGLLVIQIAKSGHTLQLLCIKLPVTHNKLLKSGYSDESLMLRNFPSAI